MAVTIAMRGVGKDAGGKVLFEDLNWDVTQFRRTGLVGPNGAGKSTLLRILAREIEPDSGTVEASQGLSVGYLPQEVEWLSGDAVLDVALRGRDDLVKAQQDLEEAVASMHRATNDAELHRWTDAHAKLEGDFARAGGYRMVADAKKILSALGFLDRDFLRPPDTLSGGWRVRLLLAKLLFQSPDLLILDEPTNHLDLEGLAWFEGWLNNYPGTAVVVSHDRTFLNRSIDAVASLEPRGGFRVYPGDYDDYLERVENERVERKRRKESEDREAKEIEAFAARFRYKATKARQVQSRLRRLEGMERTEVPPEATKGLRFAFWPPERTARVALTFEDISKSFNGRPVLKNIHLEVCRGDRIAFVGVNGSGKSTLLKIAAGQLLADSGTRRVGERVKIGYFAQHQTETLNPERTVLEEMAADTSIDHAPLLRDVLGVCRFSQDTVEKRVRVLSGGELSRLALAKVLLARPTFLVMDEPTNHLDLETREALEAALDDFEGAMIFVSHDRTFIDRLASKVIHIGEGVLTEYVGNYSDYVEKRNAEVKTAWDGAGEARRANQKRDWKRQWAEFIDRRNRALRPLKKECEAAEADVQRREVRLKEIDNLLQNPSSYDDTQRVAEIGRERSELERALPGAIERWIEVHERMEELTEAYRKEGEALEGKG